MATKKKTATETTGDVMQAPGLRGDREKHMHRELADGSIEFLTANGKLIPLFLEHAIHFNKTDQGMAEYNRGKDVRHVEIVRDEWQGTLAKRESATEPWESPDPMKDAVEEHGQRGYAYKFLSEAANNRRGLRKYEIVKDARSEPVKVGKMVLGRMPVELRDRRNAHYREVGNDFMQQSVEQFLSDQERTLVEHGGSRDDVLRPGDSVTAYDDPGRTATIGVGIDREPLT